MGATVYFSREITPEKVAALYDLTGKPLSGRVAVKLHSGEAGNQNYLRPDFWRPVIRHVGGTVVECNTAYDGQRALLLDTAEILRFFTDGKAVRVQTAQGVYTVRARLYELEEILRGQRFARISQSELVNLAHVTALDLRFSGALRMTLTGGVVCYPSRRYLKAIKQALGLR